MNKLILPALSILLAATSVPALAQREGGGRGEGRGRGAEQQQQQQQAPQQRQGRGNDQGNFDRGARDRANAQTLEQNRNAYPNRSGRIEQAQPRPQAPAAQQDNRRPDFNRPGDNRPGFNNDNRAERRFDRNRDVRDMRNFQRNWTSQQRFRIGVYFGPPNYTYRRYTWGQFLPRPYYVSNYWISNWAYYNLDFPPPGTRWVRYGPDALLIDTWNGEILQVAYNIFW